MDNDTANLLNMGREHYASKDYEKAEAYLTKVVDEGIHFADVFNMLGVIYHNKGQMAMAQDNFEKALSINPRYAEAALNLAVTCNDVGQYDKAKALYSKIANFKRESSQEIEPVAKGKLANMHADIGRAYAGVGNLERAIEQFRQALEMCPDYVDIRTQLGQALRDAGQLEEACEAFERAKVVRPTYLPCRIALGMTYLALGDRELAKREWEGVLDIEPDNVTACMYLRIVDSMIAVQEAEEAGEDPEAIRPSKLPPKPGEDELTFSFEGESTSMSALGTPFERPPEDDDIENTDD
jgi:tetratricopeptide (TPR) repeat protein